MTDEIKTENLPAVRKAELVAGQHVAPIIPRTIDEVARIANAVIIAGLAPDSYKQGGDKETASRIMIGIMAGAEIGLAPLQSLKTIAIINGRPCLWGDGAVALIQASGKVERWKEEWFGEEGADNFTAVCQIWRKGQDVAYTGEFSVTEAKRAKLTTKMPWVQYLRRMLMWRARTYAMRNGFADCLAGLSIAEEIQDLPVPPKPVNPDFLSDEMPQIEAPATPPQPPADSPVVPMPYDTAEGKAEAPDMVADDLAGHLEALPAVRDLAHLEQLDAEVREFLKEADRADLLPCWNGPKLERERALRGRK